MGAVILRTSFDPKLRKQLRAGDKRALAGFQLTDEESVALLSGNEDRIYRALGDTQYHHLRENGNYDADLGDTVATAETAA